MSEQNEMCPKCKTIFIQWDRGYFRCLERNCQHRWRAWKAGPKDYNKLENPHLIASLPGRYIPYADE